MKKVTLLFSYLMILFSVHLNSGNLLNATEFALTATYNVDTVWATAFKATVTLKNTSDAPTSSWTSTFSMPPKYILSSHVSSGTFTVNGQNVTVTNLSSNGVIPAGGLTTYDMIIEMPTSAPAVLNNLQAVANGSPTPPSPTTIPTAPVLNSIQSTSAQSYIVSWSSVDNATSYVLQQDTTSCFCNPQIVAQGNILSKTFENQPSATYYYRVSALNSAGTSPFSNEKNITVTFTPPPPSHLVAPVLNPIQLSSAQSYTVSWNGVANASSYLLQQDTTSSFSNPQTVAQGNILSKSFSNQPSGTYYYRVSASNSTETSPYSSTQSINVTNVTPPPIPEGIEHSAWYIDWTSWFTEPTFVLPTNVNLLNLFVGTLAFGSDGKPTIGGFGNLNPPQLDAFTAYCAAQNPPIAVKASIGGSGGMYDRCWDLLTSANVHDFAKGMVDYCHAHGLVGIDFDYEEFLSTEQENLVGLLIKEFKTIDPNLQTSLCTNAGFGPNYPWQPVIKTILDAATITTGNCAVDKLYIMSYYDPMENEQNWILGWAEWLEANYGFTPARVSVGIDDFDAHAYDPVAFAAWAASKGFSTSHWAFDPARPK